MIGFSANKGGTPSGDQTNIPNGTPTKITFTTEAWDIGNYYDSANSKWIPPAGRVLLNAYYHIISDNMNYTKAAQLWFYKNGSPLIEFDYIETLTFAHSAGTVIDSCNGSDYYEVYAQVDITGGFNDGVCIGDAVSSGFNGFMITPFATTQSHYRFRSDANAVDATPTWAAAEDASTYEPGTDTFRLRFRIEATDLKASNTNWQVYASKNGGTWTAITTSATIGAKSADASSDVDDTALAIPRL